MTGSPSDLNGFGVQEWFVVFHEHTGYRAIDRFVPSRFKHVSAVGYAGRAGAWVRVNYTSRSCEVEVCSRDDEARVLASWMEGPVLKIAARRTERRTWGRFGLWCVPLTAHLVGVDTCALLPDGLWRVLLANGAMRMDEAEPHEEQAQGRPGGGAPAESGAPGADSRGPR